jgi:hypothetical protein
MLQAMQCVNCAGQLDEDGRCPYCGTRHDSQGSLLEQYARCPECGRNDRVQSITALKQIGSPLAQKLAPKPPALEDTHTVWAYLIGGFCALSIMVMICDIGNVPAILVLMSPLLILGVVLSMSKIKRSKQAYLHNKKAYAVYEKDQDRFEESFYCYRDATIFRP